MKIDSRGTARVHARPEPRGRPHAEFHLSADALTLAELLAGVDHRIGRWRGPARFTGSRRKLDVLRSLPATSVSLADAARAGAELEPALVYRTLSYAVHPSWTRGERFTLAQEITGERPETWYLSARDGAGMTVSADPARGRRRGHGLDVAADVRPDAARRAGPQRRAPRRARRPRVVVAREVLDGPGQHGADAPDRVTIDGTSASDAEEPL